MLFNGLVVNQTVQTSIGHVHFKDLKGSLRVHPDGSTNLMTPFWYEERDFFGYIHFNAEPGIKRFLVQRTDGLVDLTLVVEEAITVGELDGVVLQELYQLAHIEPQEGVLSFTKLLSEELKPDEQSMVKFFTANDSWTEEQVEVVKEEHPFWTAAHRGRTRIRVVRRHIFDRVDPSTFASYDGPVSFGGALAALSSPYSQRHGRYKIGHPECDSFVIPGGDQILYVPQALWDEGCSPAELKNMSFGYRQELQVTPVNAYSPLQQAVDILGDSYGLYGITTPNSEAVSAMDQLSRLPFPIFIEVGSDISFELAKNGARPDSMADDTATYLSGTVSFSEVSAEAMLSEMDSKRVSMRCRELEPTIALAAALAGELFCSGVVAKDKTGQTIGTLPNVDRALGADYPITVFSATGNKLRAPEVEAFDDDSFLF